MFSIPTRLLAEEIFLFFLFSLYLISLSLHHQLHLAASYISQNAWGEAQESKQEEWAAGCSVWVDSVMKMMRSWKKVRGVSFKPRKWRVVSISQKRLFHPRRKKRIKKEKRADRPLMETTLSEAGNVKGSWGSCERETSSSSSTLFLRGTWKHFISYANTLLIHQTNIQQEQNAGYIRVWGREQKNKWGLNEAFSKKNMKITLYQQQLIFLSIRHVSADVCRENR